MRWSGADGRFDGAWPHEPRETVLLVDDDPFLRVLVRAELEDAGFAVQEAADVATATQLLTERLPDVVLVDVLLPGESGLELCAWLRAQPDAAHLPIVVLTGLEHDEVIEQAFVAGASDFIRKPVEGRLLRHRVQLVLRARREQRELERSEAELDEAQSIARIGSFTLVVETGLVQHSAELAGMLGRARQPGVLQREDLVAAIHPADRVRITADGTLGWTGATEPEERDVLVRLLHPGEPPRWVQVRLRQRRGPGGGARILGTFQDITEQRSREQRIEYLATHDVETGLPNAAGFTRMAALTLTGDRRVTLVQVAIDRATRIQSRLGPDRSGQLLRAIGGRLAGLSPGPGATSPPLPAPALVGRTAAAGFTLLFDDLADESTARRVAEQAVAVLSTPVLVGDHELRVTVRAGIARTPQDGMTLPELLRSAEAAVQHAARTGVRVRVHESIMTADAERYLWLERELGRAIDLDQLSLAFQPKFDHDGRIPGVEALARWCHPVEGPVGPDEFIPVAEESGLIHALGTWVLRRSLEQASRWSRAGHPARIAVNLSAVQVLQPGLADQVTAELERTGLSGEQLELEITESVLLADRGEIGRTLQALADTGARIALDDFGTGYSSLSYLTDLPLDVLKIDRSFVGRLDHPETVAVVRAIIALADGLGLQTVAEGVEDAVQARWLREAGCDLLQGFHLSRPVDAAALTRLLSAPARGRAAG